MMVRVSRVVFLVFVGWIVNVYANGIEQMKYQQIELASTGSGVTQELYGQVSINVGKEKSEIYSNSLAAINILEVNVDGASVTLSKEVADIDYELPYYVIKNTQGTLLQYKFFLLQAYGDHAGCWFYPVLSAWNSCLIDGYVFNEKANDVKITFMINFPDGEEIGPFGIEFSLDRARELFKK
jgi:hypothetical protein